MADDIKEALSKPKAATAFTKTIIESYLTPAFGSRSKAEIDLLVFSALIAAGAVDPDAPIYDTARRLNITPARVRTLLMNWQLRSTPQDGDLKSALVAALKKTRFSKDGSLLTFGVESPLLREEITARLKRKGIFPDASFARELVRMPVEAFVEFLDDILDDETKKNVKTVLVKDKLLPDKSFKALAIGVLTKLGEKAAGEAGKAIAGEVAGKVAKPVADKLGSFLSGLLSSDAGAASKSISADDYVDV